MTTFVEARDDLFQTIANAISLVITNTSTNMLPIKWPDMPFTPTEGKPWFKVIIQHTTAMQATLGTQAHYERNGFGVIEIYCPLGSGRNLNYEYAQVIVNRLQQRTVNDKVWVQKVKIQEDNRPEGAWSILNIVYNFTYTDVM